MKYFIANWKANKNYSEAILWIEEFINLIKNDNSIMQKLHDDRVKVIICPPSPLLILLNKYIKGLNNINLGVQDVSIFPGGSHTGETTAASLIGLADYAIVGHSERRNGLGETEIIVSEKINQAKQAGLRTILCVRNEKDAIENADIVAYEPVTAIGSGLNEDVRKVVELKKKLRLGRQNFLYGGSVNETNVNSYLDSPEIDGLLIGSASLNPVSFYNIIRRS